MQTLPAATLVYVVPKTLLEFGHCKVCNFLIAYNWVKHDFQASQQRKQWVLQ